MLEATLRQSAVVLASNIVAGIPTMLFGQPGLGKTSLARWAFERFKDRFSGGIYVWSTTERNAIDSGGLYRCQEIDGKFVTVRVPIEEVDFENPCFFCIDEFADAPVFEQSGWYRLFLELTLGDKQLAAGSYVMACSNRPDDNAAAREVSTAAKDRCCCITIRADWRSVADYGRQNGWSDSLVAFISAYGPEVIDNGFDADEVYGGSTPRGFERVHKLEAASMLCTSKPEIELLQLAGNIGESAARKYQTFKKLDLPSPQLVFDSPETAPVWTEKRERDLQYAYSTAVVSAAQDDRRHFKAVVDYALRIDRVTGCSLCWELKARFPSFKKSQAWAVATVEFSELLDD